MGEEEDLLSDGDVLVSVFDYFLSTDVRDLIRF